MRLKRFAAILMLAAIPVCAEAQQSGPPKPTNADAQKVTKLIAADKAKLKIYCELDALAEQFDDAEQKKDAKATDAIANKMDAMAEQLGPDYIALMDGLQDVDPNSPEGEAIGNTLAALDKMCAK
jgi:hypothetical protein